MLFFKSRQLARVFANGRKVVDNGVTAKVRWAVKVI